MDETRLEILFQQYLNKSATEAEKQEFFELIQQPGSDAILNKLSECYPIDENLLIQLPEEVSQQILAAVLTSEKSAVNQRGYKHLIGKRWLAYAATLLLILSGGVYLFVNKENSKPEIEVVDNQVVKDVLPGHNGAVLRLANGRTIVIDSAKNGHLENGFVKKADEIIVNGAGADYAILSTPRGRQQQITLSDGTKVWLNASSSLRFPTSFTTMERSVELTGEAYFEVAHNAAHPFIVKAGGDQVKVLGTRFNVNAYEDESMVRTTLQQGSLKINNAVLLKPDEEYGNGVISKVDAGVSVAWVFGYFQFEQADIKTVMRQLSRWYDIEVQYEGRITTETFGGEIQRDLKLSEVLELLSGTGIHYTLNDKILIIRP